MTKKPVTASLIVLLSVVGTVPGCESGDDDDPQSGPPQTPEDFYQRFLEMHREHFAPCTDDFEEGGDHALWWMWSTAFESDLYDPAHCQFNQENAQQCLDDLAEVFAERPCEQGYGDITSCLNTFYCQGVE